MNNLDSKLYSTNRIFAAAQVSMEIVEENKRVVRTTPPPKDMRFFGRIVDPFITPIAPYICYALAPPVFLYSLLALKYSQEKQAHVLE